MKINTQGLVDETEKSGDAFPLDTHNIIFHRYKLASTLVASKRALEIGVGTGLGFKVIRKSASFAVAGEYAEGNINTAKSTLEYSRIVGMNGEKMPFIDTSFDVVIALAMVYYMKIDLFLKESYRILDKEGTLFFCTSNHDVPGFVKAPYTTRYYSIPELKQKLEKAGFIPEFYGAFPAPGGSLFKRVIRSIIKKIAKTIVLTFPGGKGFWSSKRKAMLGEYKPLPDSIPEMDVCFEDIPLLNPDLKDRYYRVIYVVANKKT